MTCDPDTVRALVGVIVVLAALLLLLVTNRGL